MQNFHFFRPDPGSGKFCDNSLSFTAPLGFLSAVGPLLGMTQFVFYNVLPLHDLHMWKRLKKGELELGKRFHWHATTLRIFLCIKFELKSCFKTTSLRFWQRAECKLGHECIISVPGLMEWVLRHTGCSNFCPLRNLESRNVALCCHRL